MVSVGTAKLAVLAAAASLEQAGNDADGLCRCLLGGNTDCPTKTKKRRNVPCRKHSHGEWSRNRPAPSNNFSEAKKMYPGDC